MAAICWDLFSFLSLCQREKKKLSDILFFPECMSFGYDIDWLFIKQN